MVKIDPFTRTPGRAGQAYIETGIADTVITNFKSDESEKHVYKITGLQGSGKSVEYGKIIEDFRNDKKWLVYPLHAAGESVTELHALIKKEKVLGGDKSASKSVSASINAGAIGISGSISNNQDEYGSAGAVEADIMRLIELANKKKYKVLIGIDDISKTTHTVRLLSIIGSMIVSGAKLYLIVAGLSENIEDFASEKSLSFFKRADSLEVSFLNRYDIVERYQSLLGVDAAEARKIEIMTKDYAYAYQVLGSLYFNKKGFETLDDLLPAFENIMFKDSYDIIWKKLTEGEKELVRCIYRTEDGKIDDIKAQMHNPSSYNMLRKNLIDKHLVNGDKRGYLRINLPRFDNFVELWGEN